LDGYLDGGLFIRLCIPSPSILEFLADSSKASSLGDAAYHFDWCHPQSAEDPIYSAQSIPPPQPATEGSVPWQANIWESKI